MKSIKEILNLQEKKNSVFGLEHFEPFEDIHTYLVKYFKDTKLVDEIGKNWAVDEIEVDFDIDNFTKDVESGEIDINSITTSGDGGKKVFKGNHDVEDLFKFCFDYTSSKVDGILKHKIEEFVKSKDYKTMVSHFEETILDKILENAFDGSYSDEGDDYSTARPGVTN